MRAPGIVDLNADPEMTTRIEEKCEEVDWSET